jgi:hypothetical protein
MIELTSETLDNEIKRLVQMTYQSLRTSASQHGITLPEVPPGDAYHNSPLAQHIRYLAQNPADPAPTLRNIAALLHGYPPVPSPYPIPDWFWDQMPTLADILVAQSDLWIPLATAARSVGRSSPVLLDACRSGILLSLLAGRPLSKRRYIWQPDLLAQYRAPDLS